MNRVTRFAFAGRCSTEDLQDPETSRNWQLTRARALIEPKGGEIVAEYFDSGHSRALPWKRRPRAAELLRDLRDPERPFDAVVIGEPQRTFYGNQFGNTFPLFVHFGIPLWVPEVGGPIDPENEAHDLVMSVFGGMSKGERNRIKVRVHTAMTAQAQIEGRYLGGRPPYGYLLADAGPHPNPAKAADGKRLHKLDPDPVAAPVVRRIFREYLRGNGMYAIAEGLTRDGIPCPSAHDRARNRHRDGHAWSKGAVRTILMNPRYTGHQVWNKQHKKEVLLDIDDVTLGHRTQLTWNPHDKWIWSAEPVHEPLVPMADFQNAQARQERRRNTAGVERKVGPTKRSYALRGLLRCGLCDRKMQGNYNRGLPHYRCRYPAEYAHSASLPHPLAVYVRESAPTLTRCLARPRLRSWPPQADPRSLAPRPDRGHPRPGSRVGSRPPYRRRMRTSHRPLPHRDRRRYGSGDRHGMDQPGRRRPRRRPTPDHRRPDGPHLEGRPAAHRGGDRPDHQGPRGPHRPAPAGRPRTQSTALRGLRAHAHLQPQQKGRDC
ncbi:recombinase family protein [Streptomyces qinglanensis]|uniref:recombinase family protein n=1 Tax=Streptomyces qinglanensis TaxID=943816 RepID=UPI003793DCA4